MLDDFVDFLKIKANNFMSKYKKYEIYREICNMHFKKKTLDF